MRVGIGYDVHRLVEGRQLVLGGINIPFEKGLLGHSDADVLVHALCDAILGAAGMGDIGMHFPDTDAKYKDISSLDLLTKVRNMIRAAGFTIGNIDTVVFAQEPKLAAYHSAIRTTLGEGLGIAPERINIKATTTEGLGFIGKGEGIAAMATVLLE